ncbi:MAG: F0F1 ATP synthase subunit A [Anaeromyxobacteraceae bacterium]
MTTLLASLLLAVATTQHTPEPATGEHGHPAVEAGSAEHAEQHAAKEHGGGHGEAHEESLSDVMLGHVSDGYVLEYPGFCHGGFSAECETDLKEVFGDSLVFGSVDMTPTKHLIMLWLASILMFVVVMAAVAKKSIVPRGLYNFVETLVQFVRVEIAKKNIGEHDGDRFVPYLVTAFFFILFVNLFGLVPWAATATGNVAVTMALATFTFLITQYAAIRAQGLGGWLKHLTGGVSPLLWPIMIPVEILGLFTKPFALTIRLFANMIAGHIVILSLLGLIFALGSPFVAVGSVPMALAIFALEVFVAFVQAYIFTMLSSLFIGQGLVHHGGHDEEHGGAGEPGMGHAGGDHAHASHVAGNAPGHG